MNDEVRCPDWADNGEIIGCGSANITEPDDEGFCDCRDCGIFFKATERDPRSGSLRAEPLRAILGSSALGTTTPRRRQQLAGRMPGGQDWSDEICKNCKHWDPPSESGLPGECGNVESPLHPSIWEPEVMATDTCDYFDSWARKSNARNEATLIQCAFCANLSEAKAQKVH